jgi:peptide methionine sulfoxide reductase MsrA
MQDQIRQFTFRDYVDLGGQVLTILTLAIGLFFIFKRWIRDVAKEVKTSNGSTVGQYSEKIYDKVDNIEKKQSEMQTTINNNSSISREALIKADMANSRLDSFFLGKSES